MFQWLTTSTNQAYVTMHNNNITFNSISTNYLDNVNYCLVGLNIKDKQVGIKPITKKDIQLNIYQKDQLHKLYFGKGFSRITNKSLVDKISQSMNLIFKGQKYNINKDESTNIYIIDYRKEIEQ